MLLSCASHPPLLPGPAWAGRRNRSLAVCGGRDRPTTGRAANRRTGAWHTTDAVAPCRLPALAAHAKLPPPFRPKTSLQQKDKFGAFGRGRLLRITADRLRRAADARRREREAAVCKVAAGIGGHAGQVGAVRPQAGQGVSRQYFELVHCISAPAHVASQRVIGKPPAFLLVVVPPCLPTTLTMHPALLRLPQQDPLDGRELAELFPPQACKFNPALVRAPGPQHSPGPR